MWGWKPKDFWRLHPTEFHWLLDAKQAEKATGYAGGMSESDVADLYQRTFGDK